MLASMSFPLSQTLQLNVMKNIKSFFPPTISLITVLVIQCTDTVGVVETAFPHYWENMDENVLMSLNFNARSQHFCFFYCPQVFPQNKNLFTWKYSKGRMWTRPKGKVLPHALSEMVFHKGMEILQHESHTAWKGGDVEWRELSQMLLWKWPCKLSARDFWLIKECNKCVMKVTLT